MSISAYTATESISSVRHVPAPHTTADPLSRASSHTLVEDSGYRAPHYHLAATAPVARLAPPSYMSAATVSAGRVARSNNKPKEPQDTQVQCVGNSWKHPRWTVQHANGQQRTYFCWDCGAEVKEKIDHVQGKWLQSGVSRRDVSMARHIAVS
ncbi:hypothetical protein BD626DRAFT_521762 [Schizophyllum amplum]|uniref:Uncharacterized protein n=1 Tax=Schizophyllum amplum TaxID=97359 RepID=A0A550BTP2_9AGAR|nr:hypothetical protein BD626DRAFT_521762 [Auriculariopsis ampla]